MATNAKSRGASNHERSTGLRSRHFLKPDIAKNTSAIVLKTTKTFSSGSVGKDGKFWVIFFLGRSAGGAPSLEGVADRGFVRYGPGGSAL